MTERTLSHERFLTTFAVLQINREISHEHVTALREVMLEEKSIYLVFEYAEHDFLVRSSFLFPSCGRASCSDLFPRSKSFTTTRRRGRHCQLQCSNRSCGNSSTVFRTCMTTGSSTVTSNRPTFSSRAAGRSRLVIWDWQGCIRNRFSLCTLLIRYMIFVASSSTSTLD